jgi:hypothetical protein
MAFEVNGPYGFYQIISIRDVKSNNDESQYDNHPFKEVFKEFHVMILVV